MSRLCTWSFDLRNKDILWMNDCVLTMIYESLAMGSPKWDRLDMT